MHFGEVSNLIKTLRTALYTLTSEFLVKLGVGTMLLLIIDLCVLYVTGHGMLCNRLLIRIC